MFWKLEICFLKGRSRTLCKEHGMSQESRELISTLGPGKRSPPPSSWGPQCSYHTEASLCSVKAPFSPGFYYGSSEKYSSAPPALPLPCRAETSNIQECQPALSC